MRKPISILWVFIIAITLLCSGCNGGNGGAPPGTAPKISDVGLYDWNYPYDWTLTFTVGDQSGFCVWVRDPDLDIKTLWITQYWPAEATMPYYGPEPISLPSQSDPEEVLCSLTPMDVTGPAGSGRIDFQLSDARGNDSNIFTIYVVISE